MNKTTVLSLMFLLTIGSSTYLVKQRVLKLEVRLSHLHKNISHLEESMHILQAESNYLSRPERLQDLAERKLGLICANAYQVKNDEQLDLINPKTKMLHLVSTR